MSWNKAGFGICLLRKLPWRPPYINCKGVGFPRSLQYTTGMVLSRQCVLTQYGVGISLLRKLLWYSTISASWTYKAGSLYPGFWYNNSRSFAVNFLLLSGAIAREQDGFDPCPLLTAWWENGIMEYVIIALENFCLAITHWIMLRNGLAT